MSRARLDRDPLERVRAFIPASDTAVLHLLAEQRGCTVNAVIREAIKAYLKDAA